MKNIIIFILLFTFTFSLIFLLDILQGNLGYMLEYIHVMTIQFSKEETTLLIIFFLLWFHASRTISKKTKKQQ
ncbi:hypothetical protein SAMN05443252_11025 [Bacillus sp. OV322]|uniref:hypothetical protein n=1 Tax=Bacillus sp. OV322 TaxID=1882764 RepID=UPI0008ED0B73|nr:hypothetical protein [Bacillus sp. OV322]SFC96331.1 hypothetical protein SAMN05443252_11025 [Bacillus sp. OV322]